ncbi:uncharacterized protein LOC114882172 isoform X2 [Osmia bicornis bicornis]|uniref:uncharacterized protein LOC114882172 isoform X2 n=1 Tax=Osmia bicornis bicornis TaxID=1437191 RepID=UPI0010F6008E|nr:uncharacterized protein LOC114882172 isoform X2 [Osmia bicornis bicornis]
MPLGSRKRRIKEKLRIKSKSCGENDEVHVDCDLNLEKPSSDGEWEAEYLEEDVEAREFFAGKTANVKTPQRELKVADIVAEFEHRDLGEVTNQQEPCKARMETNIEEASLVVGNIEIETEGPLGSGSVVVGNVLECPDQTKVESRRKRLRTTSEEDKEATLERDSVESPRIFGNLEASEENGLPNKGTAAPQSEFNTSKGRSLCSARWRPPTKF